MAVNRESLFGIKPGLVYEARLKGPGGEVVDKATGIVVGSRRKRDKYTIVTIQDVEGGGVKTEEYPLETMLAGGNGTVELDLDVPHPSDLVGIKRISTMSGLIKSRKEREEAAKAPYGDSLGNYRVECIAHNPIGTVKIADTEAGPMFRMPLDPVTGKCSVTAEIPEELMDLTRRRNRRVLRATMHWNSTKGPETLGKPNSAFVLQKDGQLYMDYLLESPEFAREEAPKLHSIMRANYDYVNGVDPFGPCLNVYSGHVAVLPITTPDVKHVFMFDKFQDRDAYNYMDVPTMQMVDRLYAARVVPLTTNGFIIRFGQTNQRQSQKEA